jgi:hypothetical protein
MAHRAPPPLLHAVEAAIACAAIGVRHGGLGERADQREHAGARFATAVEDRRRRIDHGLGGEAARFRGDARICASGANAARRGMS